MSEGYAGGGASFETLTLYRIDNEALVPILDVPVAVQKMLAGDWNPDGSRQHEYIEAELVVGVQPRGQGMADLLLHARRGRGSVAFVWNQQPAYTCR